MEPITITWLLISGAVGIAGSIGVGIGAVYKNYKKRVERSYFKLSDPELFKILAAEAQNSSELAAKTGLSKKEAYSRMYNLAESGIIKSLSSDELTTKVWFSLRSEREAELVAKTPVGNEVFDEAFLNRCAAENNGKLSIPHLSVVGGLPAPEIIKKLKLFIDAGKVKKLYQNLFEAHRFDYILVGFANNKQIEHSSKKIQDAEVIEAAIDAGGSLTVTALCFRAKIPAEQAKQRLNELQEKDIFRMEISREGLVEYILIDQKLLPKNN